LRQHLDKSKPLRVLDICTGSGCIALALAKQLPKDSTQIIGLDISEKAISLANHNLDVHRASIQNPVEFQQKDVFDLNIGKESFNVILSNPPYITHEEYDTLDPDVKNWEDSRALVAHEQGTQIHKKLIEVAKYCRPYLNNHIPRLVMEMGGTHQIESLTKVMQENGFKDIAVWKDLAEKDRVITGY
jgi:release factor glutamine methyltransferase